MKYIRICIGVLSATIVVALLLGNFFPTTGASLIVEDSLVENLTALFFLFTCLAGITIAVRDRQRRAPLVLVASVGLLGFLDEIAFGERLFGLTMPEFQGKKIDAAHDFFNIAFRNSVSFVRAHPILTCLLLGLGVILTLLISWKHKDLIFRLLNRYRYSQPTLLFVYFGALLLGAMLLDTHAFRFYGFSALEEIFELNAAVGLFFCCLSLKSESQVKASQPSNLQSNMPVVD